MNAVDQRLLIIKPSSLGDVIHTLPLVHSLKRCYPGCSIGWVIQHGLAPLILQDEAVDAVYPISIPSTSEPGSRLSAYVRALSATVLTLKMLRKEFCTQPYDMVLDLHASFRSGLISIMNPGRVRMGFADARELNPLFQTRKVTNPHKRVHAIDKNLLFGEQFDCQVNAVDFYIRTGEKDGRDVDRFLEEQGGIQPDELLYANPAARWHSKFWLAERWAELADRVAAEGRKLVFAGSEQDRPYLKEITRRMQTPSLVAAGRLSLSASVELLRRSALYVGLDSGPMHIAAMVGTPAVALFGPTHPERVGPYGVAHRIIQAPGLDCLCCRKRNCDHMRCMEGISVSQVHSAMAELLSLVANK